MSDATHSLALGYSNAGSDTNGRLIGFALVCIVPAVFWTVLLSLVGAAFGLEVSAATQMWLAFGIAGFLGIVFAALTVNPRASDAG